MKTQTSNSVYWTNECKKRGYQIKSDGTEWHFAYDPQTGVEKGKWNSNINLGYFYEQSDSCLKIEGKEFQYHISSMHFL